MKNFKWIMLALVLCLSLIGGAYALWSESTVISAGVVTGHINPIFDNLSEPTYDLHNNADTFDSDTLITNNVSTDIRIASNGKELIFKVGNTFPGLSVGISFDVRNDGTAPVKLEEVIIRKTDGTRINHDSGVVNLGTHEILIRMTDSFSKKALTGTIVPAGGVVPFEMTAITLESANQSTTYDYELEFVWGLAYYYDF